jgi:predicted lysophospholipase L1 biosynthesis ABC-type transport system permease subunit
MASQLRAYLTLSRGATVRFTPDFLAVVGMVLSMVGLYAIVNQAATLRRFEIGVRTALGATRGSIMRMIVRHSLKIVGIGCGVGCIVTVALMRVLQSVLADRTFSSPVALLLVIAALTVVSAGPMGHEGRSGDRTSSGLKNCNRHERTLVWLFPGGLS